MWDELSFIKLKLGRVGMGRVLHLGPSWHGPIFKWAELAWAELVLGRVLSGPSWHGPSWFWAELSCTRSKLPHVYLGYDTKLHTCDVDRL